MNDSLIGKDEEFPKRTQSTGFRSLTEVLAFPRGVTDGFRTFTSQVFDDDAWTSRLISVYADANDRGPKGMIPESDAEQRGMALHGIFWVHVLVGLITGVSMAFIAAFVVSCAEELPKRWTHNGGYDDADDLKLYSGRPDYILIVGGAGLTVGILTVLSNFPEDRPGFFAEVQHCNVEYKWVPMTLILSSISMGFGASLGPEQALAAAGGGIATWLCDTKGKAWGLDNPDDRRLAVLIGFVASIASLFPTPLLSLLLIMEFVKPPKAYMEYTMLFFIAAIFNFLVFYQLVDLSFVYVARLDQNLFVTNQWQFYYNQIGVAVVIGMVCFVVAMVNLVTIGIWKQIFLRLRERVDSIAPYKWVSRIVNPTLGGIIIGTLCWIAPITVGDGSLVLGPVLQFGGADELSDGDLWASLFCKMTTMAISMNCGFVGGFLFPTLCIAEISGVLAYRIATPHNAYELPLGLFVACFMAGIPGAFAPMPITLVALPMSIFFLGLDQIVPIIVTVTTAYMMMCGSGLFQKMTKARGIGPGTNEESHDDPEDSKDMHDGEVVYRNGRPILVQTSNMAH